MHFPDLTKRLVTSVISLLTLASLLLFSQMGAVKCLIAFLGSGVASLGIWEFSKLSGLDKSKGLCLCSIFIGFLTVLAFFLSIFDAHLTFLPFAFIFFGVVFLFIYHFNKIEGSIDSLSKIFFGICYIGIPIGLILKILYFQGSYEMKQRGSLWFVYLIGVTKMADIGAYFGGRLMGKRKLAPKLSPSKTIAGAVIGFFSALILSCCFCLMGRVFDGFDLTFSQSVYLGAALGLIGQIGDLGESLFKRDAGVKDSNRLPGLGGILDMLDSLLLTAPVLYFFLLINY